MLRLPVWLLCHRPSPPDGSLFGAFRNKLFVRITVLRTSKFIYVTPISKRLSYDAKLEDTKQAYDNKIEAMKQSHDNKMRTMEQSIEASYRAKMEDMRGIYDNKLEDMKRSITASYEEKIDNEIMSVQQRSTLFY